MNGRRVVVQDGDGAHDVTESVRVVYDALHASLDYGSGFLDEEELQHLDRLSVLAGFPERLSDEFPCQHCQHLPQMHGPGGCRAAEYGANSIGSRVVVGECDCTGFARWRNPLLGEDDPLEVLRALAEAVRRDGGQLRSPYVHVPRGVARSLDESHPGWREQVDPDLVKIQEEE